MIAKLSNGVISYAPKKYTFANPPEQLLKDYAGFKDYIEKEKPTYYPEIQVLVPKYSETETQIVCDWEVRDITKEEMEEQMSGM